MQMSSIPLLHQEIEGVDKQIDAEIRHTTLIRAPIDKVFEILTTSDGLDKWLTTGAEVDAKPGGRITFRWNDWGP